MMQAHTMARIKAATAASHHPALDLEIGLTRQMFLDIEAIRVGVPRKCFLDVPIEAIVALDHRNFAHEALTWRTLLHGVHGIGWEQQTIDWMESEVGTTPFRAPEAIGDLRLYSIGGALRCGNGMHRMVAAACWLAAGANGGQGRSPLEIRKVGVTVRDAHRPTAQLICDAVGRGEIVLLSAISTDDGRDFAGAYIRLVSDRTSRYFVFDRVTPMLTEIDPHRGLASRVRAWVSPTAEDSFDRTWQTVTPRLAQALADDVWLQRQVLAPLYTDVPA